MKNVNRNLRPGGGWRRVGHGRRKKRQCGAVDRASDAAGPPPTVPREGAASTIHGGSWPRKRLKSTN
jgi:hypothetical protein